MEVSPVIPARSAAVWWLPLLLTIAAYSGSLSGPLQFDDVANITENPAIKSGATLVSRAEPRSGELDSRALYSPSRAIGFWTLAVSYRLHGLDTFGYHVENLLLHLANGLLVLVLVRRMIAALSGAEAGSHPWLALGSSALFLLHPIQTQAVTYIVQRLALLVAFFYLIAVVCYLAARSGRLTGWRRGVALAVGVLAAIAAMFSKENAATLPLMLVLCEVVFFEGPLRQRIAWLLPQTAAVAGAIGLRLAAVTAGGGLLAGLGAASRMGEASRWEYLLTQFAVVARYLGLLVLPVGQNVDHDVPLARSPWEPRVLGGLLLLSALAAAALWMLRRARRPRPGGSDVSLRLAGFGILWFFVALAVESSVFPIRDVMFEHRLYLPSVGLLLAAAALAGRAHRRLGARSQALAVGGTGIACLALALLAAATVARNRVWASEVSLWADSAAKSPGKARPHNNLGTALAEAGEPQRAVAAFQRALEIRPDYLNARLGLGRAYLALGETARGEEILAAAERAAPLAPRPAMEIGLAHLVAGRLQEAESAFRRAVALDPRHMGARYNLGTTLLSLGRPAEGVTHLEEARRLDPAYPPVYRALGDAYASRGRLDEALEAYREALRRAPDDAAVHVALGTLLGPAGRLAEAESHLLRAVELEPESSQALNGLGNVLFARGELALAKERYEASLALDPANGEAHYNLGQVLRRLGRDEEAAPHFEAAARLLGELPE